MQEHETIILTFDKQMQQVVGLCKSLKVKINDLFVEKEQLGNEYSGKVFVNEHLVSLVEAYADIVLKYDFAQQDFSKLNPKLEKIMLLQDDAEKLVFDIKTILKEITSDYRFKTDFESAYLCLVTLLAPLEKLILLGQVVHDRAREVSSENDTSKSFLNKAVLIFNLILLAMLISGGVFLVSGFYTHHNGKLIVGSTMLIAFLLLFLRQKGECRKDENHNKKMPTSEP